MKSLQILTWVWNSFLASVQNVPTFQCLEVEIECICLRTTLKTKFLFLKPQNKLSDYIQIWNGIRNEGQVHKDLSDLLVSRNLKHHNVWFLVLKFEIFTHSSKQSKMPELWWCCILKCLDLPEIQPGQKPRIFLLNWSLSFQKWIFPVLHKSNIWKKNQWYFEKFAISVFPALSRKICNTGDDGSWEWDMSYVVFLAKNSQMCTWKTNCLVQDKLFV